MGNDLAQLTTNLFGFGWVWTIAYTVASLAVAIIAAVFVYRDAENRDDLFLNLHPAWWAAAALVFSLYGVVLYWLLHHSGFTRSRVLTDGSDE